MIRSHFYALNVNALSFTAGANRHNVFTQRNNFACCESTTFAEFTRKPKRPRRGIWCTVQCGENQKGTQTLDTQRQDGKRTKSFNTQAFSPQCKIQNAQNKRQEGKPWRRSHKEQSGYTDQTNKSSWTNINRCTLKNGEKKTKTGSGKLQQDTRGRIYKIKQPISCSLNSLLITVTLHLDPSSQMSSCVF